MGCKGPASTDIILWINVYLSKEKTSNNTSKPAVPPVERMITEMTCNIKTCAEKAVFENSI